jgi:hypothetical protein
MQRRADAGERQVSLFAVFKCLGLGLDLLAGEVVVANEKAVFLCILIFAQHGKVDGLVF